MKVKRKVFPGQPGTKKLVEKFGKDLLCVRYRYDEKRKMKFKTIELIIEKSSWNVEPKKISPNKNYFLRVKYGDKKLIKRILAAGGKWNSNKNLWELCYEKILELNLKNRGTCGV